MAGSTTRKHLASLLVAQSEMIHKLRDKIPIDGLLSIRVSVKEGLDSLRIMESSIGQLSQQPPPTPRSGAGKNGSGFR